MYVLEYWVCVLTIIIVVVHDYWYQLMTGYFYSFISMQSWTNLPSIQIVEVNYDDCVTALRLHTLEIR